MKAELHAQLYTAELLTFHCQLPSQRYFSHTGGAFGLWIGWSVLTMFEFFDLLSDVIAFCCYRACARKES